MRNFLVRATLISFIGYALSVEQVAAKDQRVAEGAQIDIYSQALRETSSPSRHITYDDKVWLRDKTGRNIAQVGNIDLTLTKKTANNKDMDYFYIEYDFDNIFKGGVYGGSQTLHIDIVDSSGNIAFKDAIKLDISPDRCLKERIKKQNYMEFDWENRNIKGIELRLSAAGSQKSCRSNGAGL